MYRQEILKQIRQECIAQYNQITDWVHDIYHIKRVVKLGKKLATLEKFKTKDIFLIEIACWLHDLGRVGEPAGLGYKSNHAEVSYLKAKEILKPFQKILGLESVAKVLQAVREHSSAYPKHPENKILRILMDADRGASMNVIGIPSMLHYFNLIESQPVHSITQARSCLSSIFQNLKNSKKSREAIDKLNLFKDWYYGNVNQKETKQRVISLYSQSARKLYKRPLMEILAFIDKLKSC